MIQAPWDIPIFVADRIRDVGRRLADQLQIPDRRVRVDAKALEVRLIQAIHRQTLWVAGAVGVIVGLVRLLDAVIK